MKIVGGKQIPGTNQIGAFVTSIYPGGIAEQLHGELEIGRSGLIQACTCRSRSHFEVFLRRSISVLVLDRIQSKIPFSSGY